MKVIALFVFALVVIALLVAVTSDDAPHPESTSRSSETSKLTVEETAKLYAMRDKALHNIGWAAGNTYTHPIWAELEGFIGERGDYYRSLVSIGDSKADYFSNKRIYDEAFERGRQYPPDSQLGTGLVTETLDLIKQMDALMKGAQARLALGTKANRLGDAASAKPSREPRDPPTQKPPPLKQMYRCTKNGETMLQNYPCDE